MTGQRALARRRKVGRLELLGDPVQNAEGVGRRLHSEIKNIPLCSFGKLLGNLEYDEQVTAVLAISLLITAMKDEAS